jgi:hypothetical protein
VTMNFRQVEAVSSRKPVSAVVTTGVRLLQRSCACGQHTSGAECDSCQRARAPESVHTVLRSAGESLDSDTRGFMESRFGHDFSQVRVHTGPIAAQSTMEVHANAYTSGQDIVFAPGRYAPGNAAGRRLLAHELTHVVQQSSAGPAGGDLRIGEPGDAGEREADHVADSLAAGAGRLPSATQTPAGVVQRQFGDLNPQCSVDWQAVWEGRFDLGKHLDCCAKLPIAGKTCSSDVVEGIRKILGGSAGKGGGGKPGKKPNCPGRETPFDTCCPVGEEWDGKTCAPPTSPHVLPCLPGEQPTIFGGCCRPGQIMDSRGNPCITAPPKNPGPGNQTPQVQPPAPVSTQIYFFKDKPGASGADFSASATGEGLTNFASLVAQLTANPTFQVQLTGRASPEGTDAYNLALGQRRAEIVAQALVDAGVPSSRITDAPDAGAGCDRVSSGVFNCGERGGSTERDRRVDAQVFAPSTTP